MKLTSEEILEYSTPEDQILVKVSRTPEVEESTSLFKMSESTDKEVTRGFIVSADEEHQKFVGKKVIFPLINTIPVDTYMTIDDSDRFEYRLVKLNNVFLIEK